jgi:hypothetical protein
MRMDARRFTSCFRSRRYRKATPARSEETPMPMSSVSSRPIALPLGWSSRSNRTTTQVSQRERVQLRSKVPVCQKRQVDSELAINPKPDQRQWVDTVQECGV